MNPITRDFELTILRRHLQQSLFVIVARTVASLMISEHVLWFNSSASSQYRKLIEYICHVLASEEVVIENTVQSAKVILVALSEIYESLRSVVEKDAVGECRPHECSLRICAVFNQKWR